MTPAQNRPGILDRTALARMTHMVDADFARTILQIFREELDTFAPTLESCLRRGDDDGARRVAHTLKSASAQVGATALSELCRSIELEPITDQQRLAAACSRLVEETRRAVDHEAMALERRAEPGR